MLRPQGIHGDKFETATLKIAKNGKRKITSSFIIDKFYTVFAAFGVAMLGLSIIL